MSHAEKKSRLLKLMEEIEAGNVTGQVRINFSEGSIVQLWQERKIA